MDFENVLSYLYSQLPMFHRIGPAAYKPNLDNTIAIMEVLGQPQHKFKSVHIAGTNGKGSVSHMLAAIFRQAGYKTGLYTSPHLIDFRERIRINGEMISKEYVIDFVSKYKIDFEKISPSFFEWTVGLASQYFAEQKVDIAIIETGLGGRLDSTNVITPELSVITNISYDHMQLLGDTLEKIAKEKAGIIKTGIPVVIGERQEETDFVFEERASENKSTLVFASDHFTAERIATDSKGQTLKIVRDEKVVNDALKLDLQGNYQLKNICTVLQAVEELKNISWQLCEADVSTAISNVKFTTGLLGRWQVIQEKPLTICDVGHNKAGIQLIVEQLKLTGYKKLHFIIGVVEDKDVDSVLKLLPVEAIYYFTKANLPRSLNENLLSTAAINYKLNGSSYPLVEDAVKASLKNAAADDLIFIGGSTFVVGEALAFFQTDNFFSEKG